MKFVYTLSEKGDMPRQIFASIKTLRRFVDRENIVVIYTPPREFFTQLNLGFYATVLLKENMTEPFVFDKARGASRYGEKVQICDLSDKEIVFLDCDTKINADPTELLQGRFDFAARQGQAHNVNWGIMTDYCKAHDGTPQTPFNTGCMVFKNRLHQKIKARWRFFLKQDLPEFYTTGTYNKDEFALTISLPPTIRIKRFNPQECFCHWRDKQGDFVPTIEHGYKTTKFMRLKRKIKKMRG